MSSAEAARVLIVDDDPGVSGLLAEIAGDQAWPAVVAGSGAEAEAILSRGLPRLVLLDLGLPDGTGVAFLKAWRARWPELACVVITGSRDMDAAVECLAAGAHDYVTKPFVIQELVGILSAALQRSELEAEARRLRALLENGSGLQRLLGGSKSMVALRQKLAQVAAFDVGVLLSGESGTGKEAAAEAIHALSARKEQPFVSVDCGALPGTLLESELFGHERGAFTGAAFRKRGRVESADGGVLFLDEIGNLPLALQPKLLRFLQQRNFQRLGGRETLSVDVRVIAATNEDLPARVAEGRFRQDLYYRLAELVVALPPLREREGDLLELARAFALQFSSQFGRKPLTFSDEAQAALLREAWPGNVRQLLNAVRGACLLASREIQASHLALNALPGPLQSWKGQKLADVLAREKTRVEDIMLTRVLGDGRRPMNAVAKDLGVDIKTLHALIDRRLGAA